MLFRSVVAALFGLFICFLQAALPRICPNAVTTNFLAALLSGVGVCLLALIFPSLNPHKILIGDIMLLIPGISLTVAIRNVLVGDTIAGILRLVESILFAAALAGGFLTAMSLIPTGALQENVWGDDVWLVQLITGTLGSVGFAAIFRLRHRFLPLAALGGFLNWGCYLVCFHFTGEIFLSCLIASGLSCLYAELLAMRLRAPAPLFLIPAFIPSIPGSNLYYTLEAVVRRDTAAITSNAVTTCLWAFGIAAGISAVWASFAMARNIIRLYRTTHHAKKN